ncbi:unnamed protein product [Ceratitis capitata]|uniref:(Mediterranean fruit fly) hypothetical protein n=1 Tax=Ceratitis capitata TaxID=7213 RepID=A0A811U6Z5_CERCA|nr:unnamed protein product [Ceratitis capitata]
MFWILRRTGAANFFNSFNNNCSTSKGGNNAGTQVGECWRAIQVTENIHRTEVVLFHSALVWLNPQIDQNCSIFMRNILTVPIEDPQI